MSLSEAVEKAVESLEKGDKTEEVVIPKGESPLLEEQEENEQEEEEEEETTSQKKDEDELSEDEIKEARNLYKLLKNPETAKEVIEHLGAKTGITKVETKAEAKSAKRDILSIFEENMGPEYKFISAQLAKSVEAVLEQERLEREEAQKVIKAREVEKEVATAFSDLAKRTNGDSKKLESKMQELANEILPGPNSTVKAYINRLYTLASAGKPVSETKKIIDKITENSKDTSGRLRAAGNTPGEKTSKGVVPDKKMNVKESVEWAAAQLGIK